MANVAFLVGSNYVGTPNELGGCGNDVRDISKLLKTGGFTTTILTDATNLGLDVAGLPTRDLIMSGLKKMIASAKPGDTILFYYSGHGTQIGEDEFVVPLDAVTGGFNKQNLISSDDLHKALINVPQGVKLLMVADSCFSGNITHFDINAKAFNTNEPFKRLRHLIETQHRSETSHGALTLIAGCKENQTSTDLGFNGALTASIKDWIAKNTLAKWFAACFDYTASAMSAFKAALTAPIKAQGITDQDPQISYDKDTGILAPAPVVTPVTPVPVKPPAKPSHHHNSISDLIAFFNQPRSAALKSVIPAPTDNKLMEEWHSFLSAPYSYFKNKSQTQTPVAAAAPAPADATAFDPQAVLVPQKTLINSPALQGDAVKTAEVQPAGTVEAVNDEVVTKKSRRKRAS